MQSETVDLRTIKYRGICDFKGFYKYMITWLKGRDFDFYETRIWDKPPYRIYEMEGRKKVTYYVMFRIFPKITVWDEKPVEVIKNGTVQHLSEVRMKIDLRAECIFDYDGDFEKSSGLKKMESFLNWKILYHENLLKYLDYLDYYMFGMMTDLKKFLEMETASNAY